MQQRKHLKRIGTVYQNHPRYFITVCVNKRRMLLAHSQIHAILRKHWAKSFGLYGWAIGSYVVMPDHVHFFCADAAGHTPLSKMVRSWKQWSAKEICPVLGVEPPLWQKEFFDHLIRSGELYSEKWEYVRQNPVRARLVDRVVDWEFTGHIHYV